MDDLISRQDAIDALKNERSDWNCDYNVPVDHCIDAIYSVPSAQPESEERTAESAQNVPKEDLISRKAAIDALDKRFDKIPMEQTAEILKLRKDLRGLPSIKSEQKRGRWIYGEDEMTNKEAINLLRGLEQSLDDYCELNDEGKKAFNMAVSALELFGNTEQLSSAQQVRTQMSSADDLISRQAAISHVDDVPYIKDHPNVGLLWKAWIESLPSAQPDKSKYEYHYDHTDCIWYRPEARNRCPVTCAQYRDGWNDAMNYIFRDGKGYRPYKRGKEYGE